jgi:hypothetical protein
MFRKSSAGALDSTPLLQPQSVLGQRYEILELLGRGGMGAVYKARDREVNQLVALKVIRPDLANTPAIIERFKQELILARQVTHRNVIRIYDLAEADGVKFITMEYVAGEDLRALTHEKGKLTPQEAVEVMRQVCLALEAAHSGKQQAQGAVWGPRKRDDAFANALSTASKGESQRSSLERASRKLADWYREVLEVGYSSLTCGRVARDAGTIRRPSQSTAREITSTRSELLVPADRYRRRRPTRATDKVAPSFTDRDYCYLPVAFAAALF